MKSLWIALVALGSWVGTAHADRWFYEHVGPFASEKACARARHADPAGPTERCENRVDGQAPVQVRLSRISLGAVAGPGFSDRRPDGVTTGSATVGVEGAMQIGRAHGGLEVSGGVWGADATDAMDGARVVAPFGLGVAVQPGGRRVRADLGIAAVFAVASGCGDCGIGGGGRIHAGVDVWLSPTRGFAVDAIAETLTLGTYSDHVFNDQPFGHDVTAPRFLVRVSLLVSR